MCELCSLCAGKAALVTQLVSSCPTSMDPNPTAPSKSPLDTPSSDYTKLIDWHGPSAYSGCPPAHSCHYLWASILQPAPANHEPQPPVQVQQVVNHTICLSVSDSNKGCCSTLNADVSLCPLSSYCPISPCMSISGTSRAVRRLTPKIHACAFACDDHRGLDGRQLPPASGACPPHPHPLTPAPWAGARAQPRTGRARSRPARCCGAGA